MTYTISPTDAATAREAILDLWRRNFPDAEPNRYAWLYETGPASGFLLRSDQNRTVGATGLMRRDFCALGETLRGAQAIDLNVDRDHRTIGPAMGLQRAVLGAVADDEADLAYGFPNRQSEAVLRRVGYKPLGELDRWVKPLSSSAGFEYWGWPRWLARGAAAMLDPIASRKWSEVVYRRPSAIHVFHTDFFDARFDLLWQAARHEFPILGERTSAYLDWRFARCPDLAYRVLGLADAYGEILAYLVHGRHNETAYVADLLFAEERFLAPLLAEFLRVARREGARKAVLLYAGRTTVRETLARFGFWKRPSGRTAMVYARGGSQSVLLNPENWHLTGADIDTAG